MKLFLNLFVRHLKSGNLLGFLKMECLGAGSGRRLNSLLSERVAFL